MREIAKRQSDKCERKPKPPCPLPEVIVDQRSKGAHDKAYPEPDRLPSYEKINISMAVTRKRTRTEKHDNANDEQSQHSKEKDIGAFTMHDQLCASVLVVLGSARVSRALPRLKNAAASFISR